LGGHEPDVTEDRRSGLVDVLELRERHERLRLHGAADEHRVGSTGQPEQPRHGLRRRDVGRAAEHEAHRAVVVVVRDQDDRLAEVRIDECR
jgi:hypothetical protein